MNSFFTAITNWWGGRAVLSAGKGLQSGAPSASISTSKVSVTPDSAMQVSAVWGCVDRRAKTVASLPFFVYENVGGVNKLARNNPLYKLLNSSINAVMTPYEFLVAMGIARELRGNAYAKIYRAANGEAYALWPLAADQVRQLWLNDGSFVYEYRTDSTTEIIAASNIWHWRGLGNGVTGLSRIDYMRGTIGEAISAQNHSEKTFGNGAKPTGVLMIDAVLKPDQRKQLQETFAHLATGSETGGISVLEAGLKYQQLSLTAQDIQLLDTRRFSVEEISRWFDVPPVLVHHSAATQLGSATAEVVDNFLKFSLRPDLISIEQSFYKQVMTPLQRATLSVEFSLDALYRGNLLQRMDAGSKATQNGILTRNEVRQLENREPIEGGDDLTAQTNLAPLHMLGQVAQQGAPSAAPILQSATASLRDGLEAKRQYQQQHDELVGLIKALMRSTPLQQAPSSLTINNHQPAAPNVTANIKADAQPAPVINITNNVEPASVTVTNDVQPTPVEVNATFEATVAPAEVQVHLPARKTTTTVEYDKDGNIKTATATESDA